MHFSARLIFFPVAFFLCSCQLIKTSRSLNELPQYWLSTSLYQRNFNELTLVDYKPFSHLPPTTKISIIKAGTLVKIAKIKYPSKDSKEFSQNILVHLWVAKERGMVSYFREQEHILVIPSNIGTKVEVKSYLAQILSKKDPNYWLLALPSHIQDGIFSKHPVIGMNQIELLAALGPPIKRQLKKTDDGDDEDWHYVNYFVGFHDGLVSKALKITTKE